MDPVLQAFTGMMHTNRGGDGNPHRVGTIVVDMGTGLYCAQAVLAALHAQARDGAGRYIDASLMASAAALQSVHMMAHYLEGGQMRPGRVPSGCYPTADGWIQITVLHDADFRALCDLLEMPDAKDDPRFHTWPRRAEHAEPLTARLVAALARRDTRAWCERLRGAGIMHERVNSYLEFLEHPHVTATGAVAWLDQPGVGTVPLPRAPGLPVPRPGEPRAAAPGLDQHREEILREIGLGPRPAATAIDTDGREPAHAAPAAVRPAAEHGGPR
jgi:crotonobetainyl-CoA:carnitine CoA-transferase CaiB-like acyl-CoA transferase